MASPVLHEFTWDRIIAAMEVVRLRARRVAGALGSAGIPFMLVGGHAVRMKRTSFRMKDELHLLDLLDVGLIDASWGDRLPRDLALRLDDVITTREREE